MVSLMGGVPMGNAVPMGATVYPICSFQTPNVLDHYTLSDPLRVAPMGTPPMYADQANDNASLMPEVKSFFDRTWWNRGLINGHNLLFLVLNSNTIFRVPP